MVWYPVRRVLAGAPFLLVALLFVAPTVQAACGETREGSVQLPSGIASPPPVVAGGVNHGINVFVVSDPPAGAYELAPAGKRSAFCLPAGDCLAQAILPDFNVGWFTSAGTEIANHADHGPEAGQVPENAAYGVVYMVTGPDAVLFEGVASDGDAAAAKFRLRLACT